MNIFIDHEYCFILQITRTIKEVTNHIHTSASFAVFVTRKADIEIHQLNAGFTSRSTLLAHKQLK